MIVIVVVVVCRTTCGSFYRSAMEELVRALKVDGACKKTASFEVDVTCCICMHG